MSTTNDWAANRREAAAEHERRLIEKQETASARAQVLIDAFLETAATTAREPEPLQVRGYKGGHTKTTLVGWYLRQDQAVGIDTDGKFYILTADIGLKERLRGYTPPASPPPLINGAGGKDGESIDMAIALDRLRRD